MLGVVVAAVALMSPAQAQPPVGSSFPKISAQDITGARHSTVLAPAEANLVVVITDRAGEDAMRAWFNAADTNMPAQVHRVSIVSMKLPFFVGIDTVRSRARGQVPQQFWKDTFVDKDGALARALELPNTHVPFVYAVAPDGTVKAFVHGPANGPDADAIWRALRP